MEQLTLYKILEQTAKIKRREDKVEFLRKHYTKGFHELLAFGYDERVKWLMPDGDPPFRPSSGDEYASRLAGELRLQKHYYFVEGGKAPNLSKVRRENMFIQLLESIDHEDAKLVLCVKNKRMPFVQITSDLIEEAFGKL